MPITRDTRATKQNEKEVEEHEKKKNTVRPTTKQFFANAKKEPPGKNNRPQQDRGRIELRNALLKVLRFLFCQTCCFFQRDERCEQINILFLFSFEFLHDD